MTNLRTEIQIINVTGAQNLKYSKSEGKSFLRSIAGFLGERFTYQGSALPLSYLGDEGPVLSYFPRLENKSRGEKKGNGKTIYRNKKMG